MLKCICICVLCGILVPDTKGALQRVHLPLVMLVAYPTSIQESIGCTPFELVFGIEARLPVDVMYGLPPQTSPTKVNQYGFETLHE